jgi:hypothetical protein
MGLDFSQESLSAGIQLDRIVLTLEQCGAHELLKRLYPPGKRGRGQSQSIRGRLE